MKKYLMFVNNISGIGGAQLYILRKCKYLIINDYMVYIITGKIEPNYLMDYINLKRLYVPELRFPTNVFNEKIKSEIEKRVLEFIDFNETDKLFIESHQTSVATWAERIAILTNKNNLVYPLAYFGMDRKVYKKYFLEKLDKRLLLGCSEKFIEVVFNRKDINNYYNIPFDREEIEFKNCEQNANENCVLKLLTISRIEKTYIKTTIYDVILFAKDNPNSIIRFNIYVSKSEGKLFDELKHFIESHPTSNLEIKLHGPVTPLNNCLFNDVDMFIGMGTAALNAISLGVPTIIVDYRNNKYYGFLGVDYDDFGVSNEYAINDLYYYLTDYIKDKYDKNKLKEDSLNYFNNNYESNNINSKFLKYINDVSCRKIDATTIGEGIYDSKDFIEVVMLKAFGPEKTIMIREKIISLFSKKRNHI